jgi:hypothetical protein
MYARCTARAVVSRRAAARPGTPRREPAQCRNREPRLTECLNAALAANASGDACTGSSERTRTQRARGGRVHLPLRGGENEPAAGPRRPMKDWGTEKLKGEILLFRYS